MDSYSPLDGGEADRAWWSSSACKKFVLVIGALLGIVVGAELRLGQPVPLVPIVPAMPNVHRVGLLGQVARAQIASTLQALNPLIALGRSHPDVSIEFGADMSTENAANGFTIVVLCAAVSPDLLNAGVLQTAYEIMTRVIPVANVTAFSFLGAPVLGLPTLPNTTAASGAIRHFIVWQFKREIPLANISRSLAHYRGLPLSLPYFTHMDTGLIGDVAVTCGFCDSSFTLGLYSTFANQDAQVGYEHDPRRISFFNEWVGPFLTPTGHLVLDYIPTLAQHP